MCGCLFLHRHFMSAGKRVKKTIECRAYLWSLVLLVYLGVSTSC